MFTTTVEPVLTDFAVDDEAIDQGDSLTIDVTDALDAADDDFEERSTSKSMTSTGLTHRPTTLRSAAARRLR
ncbi:hypothetical protein D8S78_24335 [Natrialba swarupiae]|nr:hypothetical protein [Natrialba swarupiae]